MIVSYKQETKKVGKDEQESYYIVQTLLHIAKDTENVKSVSKIRPAGKGERGVMKVVPVMLNLITNISSVRLFIPKDLKQEDNRMTVFKSLQVIT